MMDPRLRPAGMTEERKMGDYRRRRSGAVCLRGVCGLWLDLLFEARQFFFEGGDLFLQCAKINVVRRGRNTVCLGEF